jgi:ABC-2 type transport system permease protein
VSPRRERGASGQYSLRSSSSEVEPPLLVKDFTSSRELLWNLTLRELRAKYKRSVLGWAWSMLNPLATMAIYTFVFGVILGADPPIGHPSGLKTYGFYLLAALLPWNFFNAVTTSSMGALVSNAGLVKKVWFPREVLIFASAASWLVSLGIELSVFSVALLIVGNMVLPWLPIVIVLMALLALFSTGLALVLSAINVYFRDTGHLWGILAQIWFFATPIVYPANLVEDRHLPSVVKHLYEANPMAVFARAFRAAMYDLRWPTVTQFGYLAAVAVVSMVFGLWVFARLSPRFAEEL